MLLIFLLLRYRLIMAENLYLLHDEYVLDRLYLEDGQIPYIVVYFRGMQSESLR